MRFYVITQERFFVVDGLHMMYWECREDFLDGKDPKDGPFVLHGYEVLVDMRPAKAGEFLLKGMAGSNVVRKRWVFKADGEADRRRWVNALLAASLLSPT